MNQKDLKSYLTRREYKAHDAAVWSALTDKKPSESNKLNLSKR